MCGACWQGVGRYLSPDLSDGWCFRWDLEDKECHSVIWGGKISGRGKSNGLACNKQGAFEGQEVSVAGVQWVRRKDRRWKRSWGHVPWALQRQLGKKSGPCTLSKAMGLMLSLRDEKRPGDATWEDRRKTIERECLWGLGETGLQGGSLSLLHWHQAWVRTENYWI